jgi:Flavoprotein
VTATPHGPVRTLYLVACAAPPTLHIRSAIAQAQDRGWDTCLILTSTAARWLDHELLELEKLTGHPVRSAYKLPGEPDVLPSPNALLVAPATSNTMNKWALGISDNLVLGLITEGIGKGLPIVALPYLNQAQAAHPAFGHSVSVLKKAGVNVLLGPIGWEPHGPGGNKPEQFSWHLGLDALSS